MATHDWDAGGDSSEELRRASALLRAEFELGLAPARCWADAIRWGFEALARAVAVDPGCARVCFAERHDAVAARVVRNEWLALLAREYALRHPDVAVPVMRLGLALDTITAAIADHVREQRLHELRGVVDAVAVVAAGAG